MWAAAGWGLLGGSALLVGALISLLVRVPLRLIGLVMGFGAGVLISAVAFELTEEALHSSSAVSVTLWLVLGACVYLAGDWVVGNAGGHRRKSPLHGGTRPPGGDADSSNAQPGKAVAASLSSVAPAATSGAVLVVGAMLDGIPESLAIGISLLDGGGVGLAFVLAVFLSNVPESMAATAGLLASGHRRSRIFGLWTVVLLVSGAAAALGNGLLAGSGPMVLASIQSFAAGAVLAMLATTMLPEAVEHSGRWVGLATALGFCSAVLLSAV